MTVYKESEEEDRKRDEDATTWKEEMKKLALASTGLVALSRLSAAEDEKVRMVKTLGMGALTAYVAVKVAALHQRWKEKKEKKEKSRRSEDEKGVVTEEIQPKIRIKAMRATATGLSATCQPSTTSRCDQ